jgi:hypothetical protein
MPEEKITPATVAAWFGGQRPNRAAWRLCNKMAKWLEEIRARGEDLSKAIPVPLFIERARNRARSGEDFLDALKGTLQFLERQKRDFLTAARANPWIGDPDNADIEAIKNLIEQVKSSRRIWGEVYPLEGKRTRWHGVAIIAARDGLQILKEDGVGNLKKGAQSPLVRAIQAMFWEGFGLHVHRHALVTALRRSSSVPQRAGGTPKGKRHRAKKDS